MFIGAAPLATGLGAGEAAAFVPDIGRINKPDELLDAGELLTFRFALEASEGKVIGGKPAREATVKQLPISKGIAGVSITASGGGGTHRRCREAP